MRARIASLPKKEQEMMERITRQQVDKEMQKHHSRFYQQGLMAVCWTLYHQYGWRNIRLVRLLKLVEASNAWLIQQYGDDWEFAAQKFLDDKVDITFRDIPKE